MKTICIKIVMILGVAVFCRWISFCFQVQKLQNIIASRASQYNHEMKRKEREFNKLKERLNQLLTDKKEKKQGRIENSSRSVARLTLNLKDFVIVNL